LYLTRTTLNIESFMGAIMSVGVSVSNSVMLVTFTSREWREGAAVLDASEKGAKERLRPILMTACAMIVGMVPMALALESGSQMEAPLGRAVVGGLLVSTFATLLILPAFFAIVMGSSKYKSPTLHPDDSDGKHFDRGNEQEKDNPGDHVKDDHKERGKADQNEQADDQQPPQHGGEKS